jgi:hypothetical protein
MRVCGSAAASTIFRSQRTARRNGRSQYEVTPMTRTLLLTQALVAGIALAFLSTTAYAATTTGVVVSTDDSTKIVTIRTEDGRQLSFLTNDATTFDPAGTAESFAELEAGDRITVTSDQAPSDPAVQLTATRLRIDAPSAAGANVRTDDSRMGTADSRGTEDSRMGTADSRGTDDSRMGTADSRRTDDSRMEMASRLPSTATPLPLLAIAAMGSILAGIGLRLRRR